MDDWSIPCIVYKICNKVNSKLYIGVTRDCLASRWAKHKRDARHPKCAHRPLYVAMREYGIDQFWIEQIEECTNEPAMYSRELELIRELNTVAPYGYNLAVRRLTDEDAAIIKFNAYQWTDKQYAQLFGIFVQTIQLVKRSSAKFSHYTPYDYITREHLPSGLKILD